MLVLAAILLAGSTPSALPPVPAGTVVGKVEPERKICRRYLRPGTFIRKVTVCRTAAEWLRNEQDYQAMARSYQNGVCASQGTCP